MVQQCQARQQIFFADSFHQLSLICALIQLNQNDLGLISTEQNLLWSRLKFSSADTKVFANSLLRGISTFSHSFPCSPDTEDERSVSGPGVVTVRAVHDDLNEKINNQKLAIHKLLATCKLDSLQRWLLANLRCPLSVYFIFKYLLHGAWRSFCIEDW